jgi:hypothetical protein
MHRLQVNIEPPSAGWLRITIAGPGGTARLCASYTPSDTFCDLVSAVRTLYQRGEDQAVSINEEPERVGLRLLKREDKLVIEVVRNGATQTTRIECGFETGRRQFALRFRQTLEGTAYEAFAERWKHRPPRAEIRQLWAFFARPRRRMQTRII